MKREQTYTGWHEKDGENVLDCGPKMRLADGTIVKVNRSTINTVRAIKSSEAMRNRAVQLAKNAYSIKRLAHLMKQVFEDAMSAYPYSNIDIDAIDWEFVASEYMEV